MSDRNDDKPRVIFFGTPQFAVPCLEVLSEVSNVVLVISQPDRPSGRGLKLTAPPVKALAERLQVPVIQPTKIRTVEFVETLKEVNPDLGVVAAYGRILPLSVLESPRLGCINIHASLLPKYRGAAPVQWSIVNGEEETGVCIMQVDEGMDTGPVLAVRATNIGPDETSGELSERLSRLGADLLREKFLYILRGDLTANPQAHDRATAAPLLRKEDGVVNWNTSARQVHNFVRGMNPWPGAFTWLNDKRVTLYKTRVLNDDENHQEPGGVLRSDDLGIHVACRQGVLVIEELQIEGKRRMPTSQFLAGHRLESQARFSTKFVI
jgi:methionyl-tRNA formyltransferase